MLIFLLRFSCPYAFDGVNNFIFVLSEAFLELGCRVIVLGGIRSQDIDVSKVFDVNVIPEVRVIEERRTSRLKLWLKWSKNGVRIIKDYNPDMIIANGVIPVPDIGFRVLRIHDVPEKWYQRFVANLMLKKFHYMVFSSSVLLRRFVNIFNVDVKKCRVIPLPIKVERYVSRSLNFREHAVLFVDGRSRRNLGFAIEVFKRLYAMDKDVVLHVVGVRSYDVPQDMPGSRIVFHGFVDRRTLRELYSRVKVLIMPSSYEGFCYPVLEAFASGTPVVGSNAIPSELLRDGYNGLRLETFDVEVYARKLYEVLHNEKLWLRLHRNARRTAEEHDSKRIALRYLKLYTEFQAYGMK